MHFRHRCSLGCFYKLLPLIEFVPSSNRDDLCWIIHAHNTKATSRTFCCGADLLCGLRPCGDEGERGCGSTADTWAYPRGLGAAEKHPPQVIYVILFGLGLGGSLLAGSRQELQDHHERRQDLQKYIAKVRRLEELDDVIE